MTLPATCFSNCSELVSAFVRSARHSLRIAVCWFTHPDLFLLVHEHIKAGVNTTLLLNYDQVNFHPQGLDFFGLEKAGAEVSGFCGPGLLHHKFAVADERCVLSGSYNWTRAEHFDHLVWQENGAMAQAFLEEFERLKTRCAPLSELRHTPARAISFQQLHRPVWCSPADIRRRIIAGAKVWTTALPARVKGLWQQCLREQSHILLCSGLMQGYWEGRRLWNEQAFRTWMADRVHVQGGRIAVAYCLRMQIGDVLVAVGSQGRVLGVGIVGSDPEPSGIYPGEMRRYVSWLPLPSDTGDFDPALTRSRSRLRRYTGSGLRLAEQLRVGFDKPVGQP